MTTKIYAYLGRNSATIDFPVSANGSVQVEFAGGNIYDEKAYSAAVTKPIFDPGVQAVIENSPMFGKQIIIYDQHTIEDAEVKAEIKEYPDVTNFAEACTILKTEYQVKATQLRSPAGVRSIADSLSVSFPNWQN